MNIDDGDEENTLLVCEYVNDIYAYLFQMERKYAIRKTHLDGQVEIHPRMRTVLMDWISEVHTQYHFAQETFHITVSTIDRYLQVSEHENQKFMKFDANIHSNFSRFKIVDGQIDIAKKFAIGWCCCFVNCIQV